MSFMRFVLSGLAAVLLLALGDALGRPHHEKDAEAAASPFKAGGLQFTIPRSWLAETAASPMRAGQWRLPATRGALPGPNDAQLVVFYFGPGLGGTASENIDGWRGTMRDDSGHPAAAPPATRSVGGFRVSELVITGTYLDPVPMAGLPPIPRPGWELVGVVVENPNGNLYWRLTGPEALVTATLPLLRQVIDSVKPLPSG